MSRSRCTPFEMSSVLGWSCSELAPPPRQSAAARAAVREGSREQIVILPGSMLEAGGRPDERPNTASPGRTKSEDVDVPSHASLSPCQILSGGVKRCMYWLMYTCVSGYRQAAVAISFALALPKCGRSRSRRADKVARAMDGFSVTCKYKNSRTCA